MTEIAAATEAMRELVASELDQVAGGTFIQDATNWAVNKMADGVVRAAEAAWQPVKLPL
jgi:hypothetical protein